MTNKVNKLNSFYKRHKLLEATDREKIVVLKEKMKVLSFVPPENPLALAGGMNGG